MFKNEVKIQYNPGIPTDKIKDMEEAFRDELLGRVSSNDWAKEDKERDKEKYERD